MATRTGSQSQSRAPLSRERVLQAAVALADRDGIDALSMRNLAQELGVGVMSLYYYVSDKDELIDGMVDLVLRTMKPASRKDFRKIIHRIGKQEVVQDPDPLDPCDIFVIDFQFFQNIFGCLYSFDFDTFGFRLGHLIKKVVHEPAESQPKTVYQLFVLGDKGPLPSFSVQKFFLDEKRDRLTNGQPAHVENFGQLVFRGDFLSRTVLLRDDPLLDLVLDLIINGKQGCHCFLRFRVGLCLRHAGRGRRSAAFPLRALHLLRLHVYITIRVMSNKKIDDVEKPPQPMGLQANRISLPGGSPDERQPKGERDG